MGSVWRYTIVGVVLVQSLPHRRPSGHARRRRSRDGSVLRTRTQLRALSTYLLYCPCFTCLLTCVLELARATGMSSSLWLSLLTFVTALVLCRCLMTVLACSHSICIPSFSICLLIVSSNSCCSCVVFLFPLICFSCSLCCTIFICYFCTTFTRYIITK